MQFKVIREVVVISRIGLVIVECKQLIAAYFCIAPQPTAHKLIFVDRRLTPIDIRYAVNLFHRPIGMPSTFAMDAHVSSSMQCKT